MTGEAALQEKRAGKAVFVGSLLVDYSCAIKLATSPAVLAAMRQANTLGAAVRGGRHLEDLAQADLFVFDKTGTLTMAEPSVKEIVPCHAGRPLPWAALPSPLSLSQTTLAVT